MNIATSTRINTLIDTANKFAGMAEKIWLTRGSVEDELRAFQVATISQAFSQLARVEIQYQMWVNK